MVDSGGDSMDATLNTIAARLAAFQRDVERQFVQFSEQFDQVNERFVLVDRQFEQVDRRFEQVDERFELVDQRFDRMEALIRSEGERTRRHFDVVAEQMKAERDLVLDLGVASASAVHLGVRRHEAINRVLTSFVPDFLKPLPHDGVR